MFVLNQEANLMYNLWSQITEVSECTLLISSGNLEVRQRAWEGCPNNAVLKKLYIIQIQVCCKRTVEWGLKMLVKALPFLLPGPCDFAQV